MQQGTYADSRTRLQVAIWVVSVWLPASGVALALALLAAMTHGLLKDMGPASGGLSGASGSWPQTWLVLSVVLLLEALAVFRIMRRRLRLAWLVAAAVSALTLVAAWVLTVHLPLQAVVVG